MKKNIITRPSLNSRTKSEIFIFSKNYLKKSDCCFFFHFLLFLGLTSFAGFMRSLFVRQIVVLVLDNLALLIAAFIIQVQMRDKLWEDVLQLCQSQIRRRVKHVVCPDLKYLFVIHRLLNEGSLFILKHLKTSLLFFLILGNLRRFLIVCHC